MGGGGGGGGINITFKVRVRNECSYYDVCRSFAALPIHHDIPCNELYDSDDTRSDSSHEDYDPNET